LPISSGTEVRPGERESERERTRFFAKRAKKINWSDSQVYPGIDQSMWFLNKTTDVESKTRTKT